MLYLRGLCSIRRCAGRFLLWVVLISLTACGSQSAIPTVLPMLTPSANLDDIDVPTRLPTLTPPPKTSLPVTSVLQVRWLAGTPCTSPCWENIRPGQTRVSEALASLNENPYIQGVEYWSWPDDPIGVIGWYWNGSDQGGKLEYPQIAQDPQQAANTTVAWMAISFPTPLNLAEIRKAYGDPSHVAPVFFSGQTAHVGSTRSFDLSLIYLSHGFLVQTERTFGPAPTIGPTMPLATRVIFFPPTLAGLDAIPASTRGWNNTSLIPWQGFQDFTSYCLQVPPANDQPDDGELACPNVKTTLP
jgi:hypothetical protein